MLKEEREGGRKQNEGEKEGMKGRGKKGRKKLYLKPEYFYCVKTQLRSNWMLSFHTELPFCNMHMYTLGRQSLFPELASGW